MAFGGFLSIFFSFLSFSSTVAILHTVTLYVTNLLLFLKGLHMIWEDTFEYRRHLWRGLHGPGLPLFSYNNILKSRRKKKKIKIIIMFFSTDNYRFFTSLC